MTAIHWVDPYHLVSAHGFLGNEVKLWRVSHDGLTLLQQTKGHEGRVIYFSANPTNPYQFFTGGEDHTLREWSIDMHRPPVPVELKRKPAGPSSLPVLR